MKSEPDTYSFAQLTKDKKTMWDGVRNYQARNNMRLMKVGDTVLFYHSMSDKAVVGEAKVQKEAYQDPTDTTGRWSVVDIVPVQAFKRPVTLAELKEDPAMQESALLRNSRLSVQPLTPKEFQAICARNI